LISRETTDVVSISLSTTIFAIFIQINDIGKMKTLLISMILFILIINFVHLIFKQLNRLSDQVSKIISIITILISTCILIITQIIQITSFSGYWDIIKIPFKINLVGTQVILLIISYISFKANLSK